MKLKEFSPTQKSMIFSGVKNLKEFGYPQVNEENIISDVLYASFFAGMLKDAKESSPDKASEINSLAKRLPRLAQKRFK